MADTTEYLRLTLPGNDEFTDVWDGPVNENFTIIDQFAQAFGAEVSSARGSLPSLSAFLSVGHNGDGTNKPSDEMVYARNSRVYGDTITPPASSVRVSALADHLEQTDFEVFYSRAGLPSLRDALAERAAGFDYPDTTISGPATAEGYPNFLTAAGTQFQLTASLTENIVFNIGGHRMRLRAGQNIGGISGAPGLRYLVATKPTSPIAIMDKSADGAGAISLNAGKLQLFQDLTVNFLAAGVKPGDILELRSGASEGYYVIAAVGGDGSPGSPTLTSQILIVGLFKAVSAGVLYRVLDPLAPALSVETTHAPAAGKCLVGHATWDGSALTAAVAYAFKGRYESPWRAVDATTGGGTFLEAFNHNLGVIPRRITILASQQDDDSGFVEVLSTAEVDNQLTVSISNNLNFNPGSLTYTDVDSPADTLSYTPPSLTGTVTGGLSGSIRNGRSVRARVNRTKVDVKNPTSNLFYIDFDSTLKTAGYLKVICER